MSENNQATGPYSELARLFMEALLRGDRSAASRLVMEAVENGTSVRDIYLHVLQVSQQEIGRLWQINRISVAEEHYCTACTQFIMTQLYPYIFRTEKNGRRMIATCVGGELHEIGVRMVADFFEMDGWDTYYLGANTPARDILDTITKREPDILGISTTISFNLSKMIELISVLRKSPDTTTVKFLVGGRPFNLTTDLYQKVGADGSAANALEAVSLANQWLD
jgi:methanogenic corrinoid protein MtbC1